MDFSVKPPGGSPSPSSSTSSSTPHRLKSAGHLPLLLPLSKESPPTEIQCILGGNQSPSSALASSLCLLYSPAILIRKTSTESDLFFSRF
ncbi:unnamed protein product [Microthlaspi erraticum]|uniref:Uncharacterized protein n=1 Tax=Microthlaspi erraticum TaxID=1685480 RepID=A0A6D2KQ77_9BRAS|nr:unnamed protein product [Microthlaspi erraticum]